MDAGYAYRARQYYDFEIGRGKEFFAYISTQMCYSSDSDDLSTVGHVSLIALGSRQKRRPVKKGKDTNHEDCVDSGSGRCERRRNHNQGRGRRRLYSTTVELPLAVIEAALLHLWSWEHAPSAALAAG